MACDAPANETIDSQRHTSATAAWVCCIDINPVVGNPAAGTAAALVRVGIRPPDAHHLRQYITFGYIFQGLSGKPLGSPSGFPHKSRRFP
ncbi:hypothetical protein BPORC_1816 [Bifidobacterium porcinum]|nr:hypothetical protein BPORC_1816 [Bifidobacterium porcinum]